MNTDFARRTATAALLFALSATAGLCVTEVTTGAEVRATFPLARAQPNRFLPSYGVARSVRECMKTRRFTSRGKRGPVRGFRQVCQ